MNTEQQYAQAFNNGYLIAKYEATLFQTVSKNLSPANTYLEGFFDGREQLELEKTKEQLLSLEQLRNKGFDRDKSRE